MDSAWLFLSGLFSLIGFAVFMYGRRQSRASPMLAGVALMVYPYFVDGTAALVGIGVLLIVAMIIASRYEESL